MESGGKRGNARTGGVCLRTGVYRVEEEGSGWVRTDIDEYYNLSLELPTT